jgi:hypothetical protein
MTTWPTENKPARFERITEPLARWLRAWIARGDYKTYDGLPLGQHEAAGALQPSDALTEESLTYNAIHQGRDVLDVVIGLAVQLGIEQGRRLQQELPLLCECGRLVHPTKESPT